MKTLSTINAGSNRRPSPPRFRTKPTPSCQGWTLSQRPETSHRGIYAGKQKSHAYCGDWNLDVKQPFGSEVLAGHWEMDWRAEFSHSSRFEKNESVGLVGVLRNDEVPVVLRAQRTRDHRRSTVAGRPRASQRETVRSQTLQRTRVASNTIPKIEALRPTPPHPAFDRFLNFCGSRSI